ncbi:MAG: 50S ribosomal protein L10 [Bacteroidales bacterium]|jgi:large subunit ribosomal protein L10|nr:50S ribosomal protein L10 [Bacteroidales bacterium]MDD2617320.1 50S ribosomal protein L10 [Bacteroidales bacterium]MDD4640167.1 50S ribosomal protein L10 [Bacteroidales bacterium]NLB01992.1 50S ribosomal protein L10 [Bacteroidales bacterium]
MKKEDKYIAVEQITQLVNEYEHFYVTDIAALNSENTSSLRRACFKEGVKLYVVKNTLLKKALENLEADYSPLYETLKGNTALMFCNTGNVPARLIKDFRKDKGIPALKAACVEECFYIGPEHLETLVNVKSKKDLVADLIALLQSPAKNVVSALQSGGTILHGVLKTLEEREN